MKPIHKDEIYEHMAEFLKAKGIEFKEGSYPRGIKAGCSLLADAINLSQAGLTRAQTEMTKNLERMRQAIHEYTAPRPAPKAAASAKSGTKVKASAGPRKRPSAKRSGKR